MHAVRLQPRDEDVLRGLFESRLLTLTHVAALYFEGRDEAAKKRLQKLKAARLVGERPRRRYEPGILFLTKKGFLLLHENGHLADYPRLPWEALRKRARVSPLTVAHELDVLTVKSAFVSAVRDREELSLIGFSTWPKLYEFRARRLSPDALGRRPVVTVRPDGFIRLREREADGGVSEHVFFLEVDRSTEKLDVLIGRASCYLDYYRSGGLARRFGQPASVYKDFPFRVLFVFKTARRRDNVAGRLLAGNPPVRTQAWLATMDEATADPLGQIWTQPSDVALAVEAKAGPHLHLASRLGLVDRPGRRLV